MAETNQEFAVLIERIRKHSERARRELIDTYGKTVLRVVRRHLHRRMRTKFDSEDFMQAVWASFFALPTDRFTFADPEALAAFLAKMTRNKVVDAVRQRMHTSKFDVNRERSLDECRELVSTVPTPEHIAMAREEWQQLLRREPKEYRQMIEALAGGQTPRDVAHELGVSVKTVRRVLSRVKARKPR